MPPQSRARSRDLQNGAYRIVFNNEQQANERHNRLNIRDTSTDPYNLNGD